MANKNRMKPKKNPLLVALYIIAVAALLGCLFFFFLQSRERSMAYKETIAQLAAGETEYLQEKIRIEETEETESAAAEKQPGRSQKESKAALDTETASGGKADGEKESLPDGHADGEPESGEESQTDTEATSDPAGQAGSRATNVKDLQLLILNGTDKSGVAGYWKTQLENRGYTHVAAASYREPSTEQTTIYTDHELAAEELKKVFPNAVIRSGAAEGEYQMADGSPRPVDVAVYVLIGKADARSE